MPLETARLMFRPPRLTDASPLFEFLGDVTAMQYTKVQASLRDCRRYLAAHERQRRRAGCAPWVIIERSHLDCHVGDLISQMRGDHDHAVAVAEKHIAGKHRRVAAADRHVDLDRLMQR